MMMRAWTAAALVCLAGSATFADDVRVNPAQALAQFKALHPGAGSMEWGGRVTALYGVPMTGGQDALDAANNFLALHARALGVDRGQLELDDIQPIMDGQFSVVSYRQRVEGLRVELSVLRVLVRHGIGDQLHPDRVVYAGAKLVNTVDGPAIGAAGAIDAARAINIVKQDERYAALPQWTAPELVVYFGEGDFEKWISPVKAWSFVGHNPDPTRKAELRFFVNAATGEVIHVRNELTHQVGGTVRAVATPGLTADRAANPPVSQLLPGVRLSTGSVSAFSDTFGSFNIPTATTAGTLTASLTSARLGNIVDDAAGPVLNQGLAFNPGDTGLGFVLNAAPTEFQTAQANVALHVFRTWEFFRTRAPGFAAIDQALTWRVNINQSCNAYFSPTSLELGFYRAGGGCNNTAFSTVVAHEFGHWVVNRRGLAQGAFGEGFGDVAGMLLYDTGQVGQFFQTSGAPVRNPEAANQQFPCSSTAIHTCGQILGGTWWEMRRNLGARLGSADGLARTRNLFVAWTLVTTGGQGNNSAHPQTAIEVLTLDDNDGNLNNGTPNYGDVCNAFSQHGISCPQVNVLSVAYPGGRPEFLTPLNRTAVRVTIDPVPGSGDSLDAGSVRVFTRLVGTNYAPIAVSQISSNTFEFELSVPSCGSELDYYLTARSNGGFSISDPANAPNSGAFRTTGGFGRVVAFADDAESDRGWSLFSATDTATAGRWERGDPEPTSSGGVAVQPGEDTTPGPGVNCFVTGRQAGTGAGSFDVDGGTTTLTSPAFNASGQPNARISYNRWYSNARGQAPRADVFLVEMTNNGTDWVRIETVGPDGADVDGGWVSKTFRIADYLPVSSSMRVRFIADDAGTGSLVEAAVDDIRVESIDCTPPTPTCAPDFNSDGVLNTDDLSDYIAAFFSVPPAAGADYNGDSVVNADDLSDYITAYFTGC